MREIKFRVVWNNLVSQEAFTIGEFYEGVEMSFVDGGTLPFKDIDWSEDVVSYLQYTGLNDKKGIEIYIGDIIIDNNVFVETVDVGVGQVPVAELPDGRIWEVTMRDFEDGIVLLNNEKEIGCCDHVEGGFSITECEVIGNIYQNPELLN